ncbi:RnfABCDGE type electron transport complex subunit D [Treponema phagedenis]|uniref:RnfABCDGE type electron transport complex subunit D n=1 Tax=Treponema phagedenis TaxID=162 RepID=UPI0015840608|nr:RnfABCDGE type electron transport complex subunit D [Treponema phagedenis]NVP24195.1 RnfABCDGE type electron transport complex subunit D [Treponema phagedenis]QKS91513.1 RnfABCDGE type electron transport complex subunit D [Treponema phagedenis]QLC59711.1 RnfABCDGE type electron transport complex subunit D [Treponema phagedenis]
MNANFSAPFVYTGLTLNQKNIVIILSLSLQLLVLLVYKDFVAFFSIFFATAGAVAADILLTYLGENRFHFNFDSLTIGLISGFFLPVSLGFVASFCISFFAFTLVCAVFGGRGSNWINPVMFAVCIAYLAYPEVFHAISLNLEKLQRNGTVFSVLQLSDLHVLKQDQEITSALNSVFLHGIGVTLPEGYISLLVRISSPIPAFRYNILTLLSSIILFSFRIIPKMQSVAFLGTYGILVWLFPWFPDLGSVASGDMLCAFLTSGVLFTAFFVLPESGSSPRTKTGRCIYGMLTGVFAFLIAGPGFSAIGIPFAVLAGNIFTPLIESAEQKLYRRKRMKYDFEN